MSTIKTKDGIEIDYIDWRSGQVDARSPPFLTSGKRSRVMLRWLWGALAAATRNPEGATQSAEATLAQAKAQLNQARTRILSPVDGYVTNLLAQLGNYVNVGIITISVVNANSFWVDGYFEETNLAPIRVGDPAQIKLMGYSQVLRGHVDSVARAINVSNARPDDQGVATVNPIFTWVRLAQRIPVRIHLDNVPPDVILAAGMTVTVEIGARHADRQNVLSRK